MKKYLLIIIIFISNSSLANDLLGTKYFQFSYGYLANNYSHFDSSLQNGSIISSLRFMADISNGLQFGVGISTIQNKKNDSFLEDLTALQYQLCWDWVRPIEKASFAALYGFAISLGDYSVRKVVNINGIDYKQTLTSGSLIGILPNAGLRYQWTAQTSLDFVGTYDAYLGPDQKYFSGLSASLRLSGKY